MGLANSFNHRVGDQFYPLPSDCSEPFKVQVENLDTARELFGFVLALKVAFPDGKTDWFKKVIYGMSPEEIRAARLELRAEARKTWRDRQRAAMEAEIVQADPYAEWTIQTAKNPGAGSRHSMNLTYLGLGLAGEAGEVAGKLSKLIRDGIKEDSADKILDECGDVMWFLCRLITDLGSTPTQVMTNNLKKLLDRMERNQIQGEGDNR